MFEFLADQLVQFIIGVFVAVLAIIITIIIYLKQRNRKRLSYEILSNTAVLSSAEEVKNDIQLSYKGKAVEDVTLLVLRIFNSGNLPIVSADYEQPISIEFGKETRILTAESIKKNPNNLPSALSIENRVVTLFPALLNPRDSITIKLLVTKYRNNLQVNSRISGIKRVERVRESHFVTLSLVALSVGLLIWAFGSLAWSFVFRISLGEVFSYVSAIFFGLTVFATIGVIADKEYRKRLDKGFRFILRENEDRNEGDKCND